LGGIYDSELGRVSQPLTERLEVGLSPSSSCRELCANQSSEEQHDTQAYGIRSDNHYFTGGSYDAPTQSPTMPAHYVGLPLGIRSTDKGGYITTAPASQDLFVVWDHITKALSVGWSPPRVDNITWMMFEKRTYFDVYVDEVQVFPDRHPNDWLRGQVLPIRQCQCARPFHYVRMKGDTGVFAKPVHMRRHLAICSFAPEALGDLCRLKLSRGPEVDPNPDRVIVQSPSGRSRRHKRGVEPV